MQEDQLIERTLHSEEIFNGKILHLYHDTVRLPNGGEATREVIRHTGAVCIVPLLEDGRVILERQFRYPVGRVITEIPAGKLDRPDEDPLAAAQRELREETGFTARDWLPLGTFLPAAAYCDEAIEMYLARGLSAGTQELDADEFLNVEAVPLETLVHEILSGSIADAKTQAAVLKAYLLLRRTDNL